MICLALFQVKASLYEIGGYDVETGGKPFDPLNLCKYIPAATLRKYEVVHCRVAMLACVGYAFPREFPRQYCYCYSYYCSVAFLVGFWREVALFCVSAPITAVVVSIVLIAIVSSRPRHPNMIYFVLLYT